MSADRTTPCRLEISGTQVRVVLLRSDRYWEATVLRTTVDRDGFRHLVCDRRIHNNEVQISGWRCNGALVSEFHEVPVAEPLSA